ncbi:MAG: SUMF1/EgtB/PvdO family nonheme iron enzyme [bacterium]|nr:SUMF1/EgtB/PvdO family nonheme iron enzyme [bacterium]
MIDYFLIVITTILFILALIFFRIIVEVIEQWINKFLQWFSVNMLRQYDKSLKQYLNIINSKLRQEMIGYIFLGEKLDLEKNYIKLKLTGVPPGRGITSHRGLGFGTRDSGFDVCEIEEILKNEQESGNLLLVTGESGAGKTTMLKHLAYQTSLRRSITSKGIRPIPVFITITEWMETNLSLVEYIFACINEVNLSQEVAPQKVILGTCPLEFIENKLATGKFLILLDGFDEENKKQTLVKEQILTFINHPGYKNNKIIITSRHKITGLANFKEFEILELTPLQQRLFLEGLMSSENDFDFEECKELITAIEQNSKIAHLTKNPLLLTLVYIIFKYALPLPQRKTEVYESVINLRLKDNAGGSKEQQIEALKNIAWHYHTNQGKTNFSENTPQGEAEIINEACLVPEIESLLKEIGKDSGIICNSTSKFIHHSFQEYLAAAYINNNRRPHEREEARLVKILLENLQNDWWENVVLFYAGMVDNASNFVKKILTSEVEEQRKISIAARCLLEIEGLNEDVKGEVLKRLIEVSDGGDKELFDKIFGFFPQRVATQRGEHQQGEPDEDTILIQGLHTVTDRELRYRLVRLLETGLPGTGLPDKSKKLFEAMKDVFKKDTYGNILYFAMQILEKIAGSSDSSSQEAYQASLLTVLHSFKGSGISQVEIQMALIPAGRFLMGSSEEAISQNKGSESEQPIHEVYLDLFYMDKTPVTNAEYEKFDPGHKRCWEDEKDDQPVVNVSWYEAYMYALWAGKRLPSEAEWEKVARGTDARKYPWGNKFETKKCNTNESKIGKTTPVRKYKDISENPSYGCLDMAGNVLEWCADWYGKDYYRNNPDRNPKGADKGIFRVARGGSWYLNQDKCRCSSRFDVHPDYKGNCLGFRCAKTL